jgi:hypothetical protein
MKIQETDNSGQKVTPSLPSQPKHNRWLAGIGAIIVVILLVGLSTLLFAQLRQHQAAQTAPTPPTGRWQQVLKGYTLISITAARSDPAIVYACVAQGTSNGSSQSNTSTFTILRSADFGDHWQDIGKNVIAGDTCQIAVNSANSDDIYAVSYGNSMPNPAQLKHSKDGGKTWETVLPLMHVSSLQTPVQWAIQQMRVEDNRLFGIQWILPRALPASSPIKAFPYLVPRLATSVDGGHNWTIIDNQFTAQRLGMHSYAVDPDNSNTIYELIGTSLFPINLRSVPTSDPLPIFGINQELYKTTDGGATWQSVLKNIPYASQVQLASGNPQTIYVGGTMGPLPLLPGVPRQSYPVAIGTFHLQMSRNGGSTWNTVAIPSDMQSVQNWFVSSGGQVYTSPTIPFSSQPTVIPGTIQPVTPVSNPNSTPQTGIQGIPPVGADLSRTSPMYRPSSLVKATSHATQFAPLQSIRRYDPNTNTWRNVTNSPTPGFMLQLTPAQSTSGVVLWFIGMGGNSEETLYRYVV